MARGCAWLGGMCGQGACVAESMRGQGVGGMCMARGHAWPGGMHGQGVCMARGLHAWPGGTCVAWGAWPGGVHGWGACVTGDMHGGGRGVWWGHHVRHAPPWQLLQLQHMVNERAVRILLECILV